MSDPEREATLRWLDGHVSDVRAWYAEHQQLLARLDVLTDEFAQAPSEESNGG